MAFIYAIEEINSNPAILPNVTLGYEIYDSCSCPMRAIHGILKILSSRTEPVPNYSCKNDTLIGFIGDQFASASYSMAQLLGIFNIPQISFGTGDPLDKMIFPSFYHTSPNEFYLYAGIIQLLNHFGWTYIGILTSDDDSGERNLQEMKKEITQSGGCVEFSYKMSPKFNAIGSAKVKQVIHLIRKHIAQVIILVVPQMSILQYLLHMHWANLPPKMWVTSLSVPSIIDTDFRLVMKRLNGTLTFSIRKREILGLKDFLGAVNPLQYSDNDALAQIWHTWFHCKLTNRTGVYILKSNNTLCLGNETWNRLDLHLNNAGKSEFAYSMYTAVYALAHALHSMLPLDSSPRPESVAWRLKQEFKTWKLNRYLQKLRFTTTDGEEFSFEDTTIRSSKYDITNWIYYPNETINGFQVGTFDPLGAPDHRLIIKQSSIIWPHLGLSHDQIPLSVCTNSCLPGFRKAPIEGRPLCCYDCVPCAEGEFSNSTDRDICMKCPETHWPNVFKDGCITKQIAFLSFGDILGMSLSSIAILCSVATAGVLGIFLRHRDTRIVKANNRNLSYALLVALMLAFLCSLLFIGYPETWTCFLQQSAFGVTFTLAVSCVLMKTITVVIAFNATKPGSRWSRWLGSRVSGSVVFLCTMGEVTICLCWMLTNPPYPNTDMLSERGKINLQCDQGSTVFFYAVIGYMGLLALGSFVVAFLARNLPDRFNEAQLITFSMLVFCSVWVSFIPAYLSTKGRYMVAVEIFAILASSAAILVCIFIPKCYIILLRPDTNLRDHLVVRVTILTKWKNQKGTQIKQIHK